jgi:hypothetical protein
MMVAVTSDASKRFRGNAILILDNLSKRLIYNYKWWDGWDSNPGPKP